MNVKFQRRTGVVLAHASAAVLLGALLTACGGGGGSPGTTGSTAGTGSTSGGTSGTASSSVVKISMTDASGASVTSLSGGQAGIVKVTATDSKGVALPNAIVKFTASDPNLVSFTPDSASALTDSTGVATVTIKPSSFTAAGALSITATVAAAGGSTTAGTASFNMSVGAAPLTIGTLSFNPAPSGSLPAFNTITLNVPVTSNGQPVATAPGLTLTSLCVGDNKATIVPGQMSNGVQVATYTNNGCLRGTDTITAAIGNSSKTITLAVDSANIGTIQFSGSDLTGTSIVLKGSGGLGRKEAAVLTFQVVDQNNNGLAGVDVNFKATTYTGGLTVLPATGTTDANGKVTTTVSAGTIPTPVRVIAEATRNGKTISGLSDALTISTGLPIQKSMSLSAEKYNIEGMNYDGETTNLTVLLADQYGNPIADGTTVNFITEGGAVGAAAQGACNTTNGSCSVPLRSQEFRPTNGRVTVLAYAQGIEDFVDLNGDGQYSCTNYRDANGNVPAVYRPLVDTCVSGGEPFTDLGDAFLDTGVQTLISGTTTPNGYDGTYDAAKGDLPVPYGHTGYQVAGDGKWGVNYIRRSIEVVFSGSVPKLIRQDCSSGSCVDWTAANPDVIAGLAGPGCSAQVLTFRLTDSNNNPMPAGTGVSTSDTDKVAPGAGFPDAVPSSNAIGGTYHQITIKPDQACASGSFNVKIVTPKGIGTAFHFKSN